MSELDGPLRALINLLCLLMNPETDLVKILMDTAMLLMNCSRCLTDPVWVLKSFWGLMDPVQVLIAPVRS